MVSDGSPRVEEIRAAVASMNDARFRLVEHEENRGLAAARNTGIREARADKVICVDEDDTLAGDSLKELLDELLKSGVDIVCPQAAMMTEAKRIYSCYVPSLEEILYCQPLLPCGFLFRRDAWALIQGWDEHPILRYGREDHEWWIRVILAGVRLKVISDLLYQYRLPTAAADEPASLNCRARLREVQIRQYIVGKHRDLYKRYAEARRAYLREAYRREAQALMRDGRQVASAKRWWQAVILFREWKDLKCAVRATLDIVLDHEGVESLLRWRRRMLGRDAI